MHPQTHAETDPAKPAIIMAGSGQIVSYGELNANSNRLAHLFRAEGLKPGDVIALFLENNPQILQICWAAQRAGLYFTAIPSRLTAAEVAYIIEDCGARIFLTSDELASVAAELDAGLPNIRRRLMIGQTIPGYESYEAAIANYPDTPVDDQTSGLDLLYSSGTTGRPKGVKRPLSGLPVTSPNPLTQLTQARYGFGPDTIYLSPAPLYHAAPLRFCMTSQIYGGTVVVMEHFDAEESLKAIEKFHVTIAQFVPTMFVRMLKLPDEVRARYSLPSLRLAIHAAAPCPIHVKERIIAWWGPRIVEYYAGSEGNGACFITSEEWLAHKGSVGKPSLGTLHIVGENGEDLGPNQTGIVFFEGGPKFEYHNDPKKTAEAYNDKGWSTLGDVGHVDAEGYLYLTDRKAFMIISGGVNIYPQEAENILIEHPEVADVAVIGVPNEDFGEEVKAVVQPVDMARATPALAEELIAFCRARLSALKCPRSVDFEAELPRHPTGKLYKRLLRDRYWGNRGSRIV